MTHRETKKEAKRQDIKSNKPETIHAEEIEKHKSKGVIRTGEQS